MNSQFFFLQCISCLIMHLLSSCSNFPPVLLFKAELACLDFVYLIGDGFDLVTDVPKDIFVSFFE